MATEQLNITIWAIIKTVLREATNVLFVTECNNEVGRFKRALQCNRDKERVAVGVWKHMLRQYRLPLRVIVVEWGSLYQAIATEKVYSTSKDSEYKEIRDRRDRRKLKNNCILTFVFRSLNMISCFYFITDSF